MIEYIKLKDYEGSCPSFSSEIFRGKLSETKGLSKLLTSGITFNDGLNIVVGEFGSGKSVIQRAITKTLQCQKGGTFKQNNFSLKRVDSKLKFIRPLIIDSFKHDDSAVLSYDSRHEVGLIGGSFDDDFFHEGIMNATQSHRSSGQKSIGNIHTFILSLVDKYKSKGNFLEARTFDNTKIKESITKECYDKCELTTTKPTIIIDEFETGLPLHVQDKIMYIIYTEFVMTGKAQVILFTHSPTIFEYIGLRDVNLIELTENYIEVFKTSLSNITDSFKKSGD